MLFFLTQAIGNNLSFLVLQFDVANENWNQQQDVVYLIPPVLQEKSDMQVGWWFLKNLNTHHDVCFTIKNIQILPVGIIFLFALKIAAFVNLSFVVS